MDYGNHWTTVIIEDIISQHPKIIPTLKKVKDTDFFIDNSAVDLKVTYIPKGDYDASFLNRKITREDKLKLAKWLYENQGARRFSAFPRLYVVLAKKDKLEDSWKLKRNFDLIKRKINEYFNSENPLFNLDFEFGKKDGKKIVHSTTCGLIFIID